MEKKSLGRGLEEISDIFLSTAMEKKVSDGFSQVKLREENCSACIRVVNESPDESKCEIFTFENDAYGVSHMDTIPLDNANYCDYFEPNISECPDSNIESEGSDLTKNMREVEEKITMQKKITYPNTPNAQKNILRSLNKFLEKNYSIRSIELTKIDNSSEPGMKKCMEEEITISIKEPPSIIF